MTTPLKVNKAEPMQMLTLSPKVRNKLKKALWSSMTGIGKLNRTKKEIAYEKHREVAVAKIKMILKGFKIAEMENILNQVQLNVKWKTKIS
jgi:hypothetical protein